MDCNNLFNNIIDYLLRQEIDINLDEIYNKLDETDFKNIEKENVFKTIMKKIKKTPPKGKKELLIERFNTIKEENQFKFIIYLIDNIYTNYINYNIRDGTKDFLISIVRDEVEKFFGKSYIEVSNEEKIRIKEIDKMVLNTIKENDELCNIFSKYITVNGKKINIIKLTDTIKYLHSKEKITADEIFEERTIKELTKDQLSLLDYMPSKYIPNLIYYGINTQTNPQTDNIEDIYNIDKVYNIKSKIEPYKSLREKIEYISGTFYTDEELNFFIYLTYISQQYEKNKKYKIYNNYNYNKRRLVNSDKINAILKLSLIEKENLQRIITLYNEISKNKTNFSNPLEATLNLSLLYYDTELFKEITDKNFSLDENKELEDKLKYLSQNNKLENISNIEQLKNTDLDSLTKMKINIDNIGPTKGEIRYHPFGNDITLDEYSRCIVVIDKEGNQNCYLVKYDHPAALREIYNIDIGIAKGTLGHTEQIKECVNKKDDIIIIVASKWIEILFNKNVTQEQIESLKERIANYGELGDYTIGLCNEKNVTALETNGSDSLKYKQVIDILNRLNIENQKGKSR